MNKTLIIILREYSTRVSKKSFILLTLLMPVLFAALIVVPIFLGKIEDDEQKKVVVVDRTGKYLPLFKTNEKYLYVPDSEVRADYKSDDTDVEAVVLITGNLANNPNAARKPLQP